MPVNSTHADYDMMLPAWVRARDVFAGEDAIKAAGERYLPRLVDQRQVDYDAYRTRASFFNATARTVEGFIGLIFRRDPTVKLPDRAAGVGSALRVFAEEVDLLGTSLYAHARNVVSEVITVGRGGTLIDWQDEGQPRAYVVRYNAEAIRNWKIERVGGRNEVTLVVLHEYGRNQIPGAEVGGDEYEEELIPQLRVLRLVPMFDASSGGAAQWQCVVQIFQEKLSGRRGRKSEWLMVDERVPLRLGKPLEHIPFVFHGPCHSLPHVDKMPLADIIAVNLDHYRLNADYKHGLHFTALPTAYLCGFDKARKFEIGSPAAWVTDVANATAGFLEFKGQGLTTFERAMDRDERQMAILGSRILEGQKRVGETAEAIELRQSGESSVLATLAVSVSDSLSRVLQWVYWWNSTEAHPADVGEDLVLVRLNTDFSVQTMSSQEMTAVVGLWQAGAISQETMFDLFRRGEVLPPGRTDEAEKRLVAGQPELKIDDGGDGFGAGVSGSGSGAVGGGRGAAGSVGGGASVTGPPTTPLPGGGEPAGGGTIVVPPGGGRDYSSP